MREMVPALQQQAHDLREVQHRMNEHRYRLEAEIAGLKLHCDELQLSGQESHKDEEFWPDRLSRFPKMVSHGEGWPWLAANFNRPDVKMLEVGSRSVISKSSWKKHTPQASYTGFDYMEGPNVDVVGDAHELALHFQPEQFDLVVSFAVFEHLACPWLVAEQIAKVLKVGGVVFIETHFSYSEHETPWHFFQFNSHALEVLFSEKLGFEILDSGLSSPIIGRFAAGSRDTLRGMSIKNLYCHSGVLARKVRSTPERIDWHEVARDVANRSSYPAPESGA